MLLNTHFPKYQYHFENYTYIIVKTDWIWLSPLFVFYFLSNYDGPRTKVFKILFIVIFFVAYNSVYAGFVNSF